MAAVPADQLAIQWDARYELAMLEGGHAAHGSTTPRQASSSAWRAWGPPCRAGAELGFHFCYGDDEHGHFAEPGDSRSLVDLANAVVARLDRPLDFLHCPCPPRATDEAWFAPLADLALAPGTDLYLGLVHPADGAAGARPADRGRARARGRLRRGHRVRLGPGRRRGRRRGCSTLHREVSAPLGTATAGAGVAGRLRPRARPALDHRARWTPSGVTHDHVEGHGWYANLDPTVEDLAATCTTATSCWTTRAAPASWWSACARRIGDRRVGR